MCPRGTGDTQGDHSGADGTVPAFLAPGGGGLRSQSHVGTLGGRGTAGQCRSLRGPVGAGKAQGRGRHGSPFGFHNVT